MKTAIVVVLVLVLLAAAYALRRRRAREPRQHMAGRLVIAATLAASRRR
jgi:hypothetical protein